MLSFEEFMDKIYIIMDKSEWVHVMMRHDGVWDTYTISKKSPKSIVIEGTSLTDEEAYDEYKEHMESYGFKTFPIYYI